MLKSSLNNNNNIFILQKEENTYKVCVYKKRKV